MLPQKTDRSISENERMSDEEIAEDDDYVDLPDNDELLEEYKDEDDDEEEDSDHDNPNEAEDEDDEDDDDDDDDDEDDDDKDRDIFVVNASNHTKGNSKKPQKMATKNDGIPPSMELDEFFVDDSRPSPTASSSSSSSAAEKLKKIRQGVMATDPAPPPPKKRRRSSKKATPSSTPSAPAPSAPPKIKKKPGPKKGSHKAHSQSNTPKPKPPKKVGKAERARFTAFVKSLGLEKTDRINTKKNIFLVKRSFIQELPEETRQEVINTIRTFFAVATFYCDSDELSKKVVADPFPGLPTNFAWDLSPIKTGKKASEFINFFRIMYDVCPDYFEITTKVEPEEEEEEEENKDDYM